MIEAFLGLYLTFVRLKPPKIHYINIVERTVDTTVDVINSFTKFAEIPDLDLFARVVYAESGNQGLYGQQLVVDVILNRVDSPRFPNTLYDVLTQPSQFSVVGSGAIWNITPTEETYKAIFMEMDSRENYEILFFAAGGYNSNPAFQYKDHYFGY